MKAKIHVNQHVIRRNHKKGENESCITVKTYKENHYCYEVQFKGPGKVMYRPDNPLPCGAYVWIEVDFDDLVLVQER